MRLYLDDDSASPLLAKLLQRAGHDVQMPVAVGLSGAPEAAHLMHAIGEHRVCVTRNHDDFWILHSLVMRARGHHPGIFVVRLDNDPRAI